MLAALCDGMYKAMQDQNMELLPGVWGTVTELSLLTLKFHFWTLDGGGGCTQVYHAYKCVPRGFQNTP